MACGHVAHGGGKQALDGQRTAQRLAQLAHDPQLGDGAQPVALGPAPRQPPAQGLGGQEQKPGVLLVAGPAGEDVQGNWKLVAPGEGRARVGPAGERARPRPGLRARAGAAGPRTPAGPALTGRSIHGFSAAGAGAPTRRETARAGDHGVAFGDEGHAAERPRHLAYGILEDVVAVGGRRDAGTDRSQSERDSGRRRARGPRSNSVASGAQGTGLGFEPFQGRGRQFPIRAHEHTPGSAVSEQRRAGHRADRPVCQTRELDLTVGEEDRAVAGNEAGKEAFAVLEAPPAKRLEVCGVRPAGGDLCGGPETKQKGPLRRRRPAASDPAGRARHERAWGFGTRRHAEARPRRCVP